MGRWSGLVTTVSTGPRGAVELLVRRDWAEGHLKTWAGKWSRAIEAGSRLASRQRPGAADGMENASGRRPRQADDRIVAWIDQELKRLDDPAHTVRTRRSCPFISPGATSAAWSASPRPAPGLLTAWLALRFARRRNHAAGRPERRP